MKPFRVRHRAAFACAAVLLSFLAPSLDRALAASANPYEWAGSRSFDATSTISRVVDDAAVRSASGRTPEITSGADGEWQRIAPPKGVHRLQPATIYDPVRNRLVTFGGSDQNPDGSLFYTNSVSVLNLPGGAWVPLATSGTPPAARRLHRAIYDPNGDRMIVYGGWNDALLDDVWQLSLSGTPTWTQLAPTGGGPGARAGAGVVYDASAQRMLVFGGFDGVSGANDRASDVWALSLTGPLVWSQLVGPDAGPPGRSSMTAVYDPSGPAMLIFGGTDSDFSNEVWKLSLSDPPAWSLVSTTGAAPSPREEQAGGFDPASHRLAIYGGYNAGFVFNDFWTLDTGTNAWTRSFPTPRIGRRWGAGSTVANGFLYVHGGRSVNGSILGDFWKTMVGVPTTWTTYEQLLPPRLQEVMVHDTNRDRLVVFGGTDGQYRNDTYTHSMVLGTGWDPLVTSGAPPAARRLHTGIYDPVGDRILVFGGYDDVLLGDLWQLSFATSPPTWSPVSATGGGPSPRGGHVAIYDPENRQMVVFGGYDGVSAPANRIGDTWVLSLDGPPVWTQLSPGPGPTARSSMTAVYDAAHHAMVVFAGTDPNFRNDVWSLSLDSPAWSLISADTAPGGREEQGAAYDSKRDRMVIFGGYDSSITNYGDLWSLGLGDSPAWSTLAASETPPSARWGMKMIYDATRDGIWLYGGWDYTYCRDLWMLQFADDPVNAVVTNGAANTNVGVAHLSWTLPAGVVAPARIERSADGTNWTAVGAALPGKTGALAFDDHTAPANQSLAWRARVATEGDTWTTSALWATVPGSVGVPPAAPVSFALRPAGRAVRTGAIAVECSLPRADRATLELLDVQGRVLDRIELRTAGTQRVELGRGLPAGLFFARLAAGRDEASLKLVRLP